jgi:hypothetical protein
MPRHPWFAGLNTGAGHERKCGEYREVPLVPLALGIVGLAILYALFGVLLFRSLLKGRVSERHYDLPAPILQTAGTIYAVLLAFSVIAVWQSYGAAKDNVAEEASTLATLYRQTNGLPNPPRAALRRLLRNYTEAVVVDEWPIQAATGGASPRARKELGAIYRAYGAMDPKVASAPIAMEFLQTLRTVAADRNRRTLEASEALPVVLWVGLLIGGVIVVGMTFVLHSPATYPHILFSVLLAALIGTLLFITAVLHRPFDGPLGISPDSFEHSLSVFDSVDSGN